jgi:aminopeptidase N
MPAANMEVIFAAMSIHCCRHHASVLEHLADGARGFQLPGDGPRWGRARPFAIERLEADIELQVAQRSISAIATLRVRRVDNDATALRLDATDFEIAHVSVEGSAAEFTYDGRALSIPVPPLSAFQVEIRYTATPQRGLYFVAQRPSLTAPDPDALATEVWSQGQDEDNRCWLPLADHPGERLTTVLRVTAPKDWFVLSNGVLQERTTTEEAARFVWAQEEPHAPYLITLACGRFDEAHTKLGELLIDYYVPVGRGGEIERSLGKTPRMIALFEKKLGTRFPWAKYAQVVVHDFIFGGMENTSATTLYDRVLLDERAAIDVDMESLVAHELAHQWFGDFVTCRDWSHAWLNEGFATYLEHIWREHEDGRDAYLYGLEQDLDTYLDEDRDRYRRAIVTNVWAQPIDIFDRHLYQKGGLVLHALRRHLGDAGFFGGLAHYLKTMGGRSAETRDLMRALEDATGKSLEQFFDQYVLRAGFPTLEVSSEYDASVLRITVAQTQSKADGTGAFTCSLPIRIVTAEGEQTLTLALSKSRESFAIPLAKAPRMILVDPESDLHGTIDNKLSTSLLAHQLAHADSAQPRWRAARSLARRNESRAMQALMAALSDASWMVRAEVASALGEQRNHLALEALLKASRSESDARVRRAIASALGRFESEPGRSNAAADRLLAWIGEGDRSYLVEAELRRALGRTRDERALEVLAGCFRGDAVSWNDSVRQGAVDGLGALRDVGVIATLKEALHPKHAASVRRSAMVALGKARVLTTDEPLLGQVRESIARVLEEAFDPGVRSAGARSLASLRDLSAAPILQRLIDRDLDGRVRRVARESLRDLRDRNARGRETTQLRDDLEKLQREVRELRDRMVTAEAKK